jgi:glutaminase
LYDPPVGQEVTSFEDYDENERESFRNTVQTWRLPILRNTQGKYVYEPRSQWNTDAFTNQHGVRPLDRDRKGVVTIEEFSTLCAQQGIRPNDRRLNGVYGLLLEKGALTVETFLHESLPARTLLKSMMTGLLVVPEWKRFVGDVRELFESVRHRKEGANAHYIPPLRDADPEKWGLAICTVDGQQATMGDSKIKYTAQSTSKPLTYCLARELHGEEKTHSHVGHEPSGRLFNEVVLNKKGRPHNPLINAGAIMCASLIETTRSVNHRMATLLEMWRRVIGEEVAPGYNEEVYQGETSTANRNRCLTYFMAEMNAFPEGNDLEASLSLYFKACSIEVNVEQHAVAAATLASGGICPITGERVFAATTVQNCLSLMQTCGMYDYSGEFCYRIGLPAKSGVAGAVMVVVPNVMGIVTFSPRLDEMGNSVRGVAFCETLVQRFAFHQYIVGTAGGRTDPTNKKQSDDSATAALWAATKGDLKALQALGANGNDLAQADYDGRTPLHLAAAEGHAECAYFLSNRSTVDVHAIDRFGHTALDEARRIGAERVVEVLQQAMQHRGRTSGRF